MQIEGSLCYLNFSNQVFLDGESIQDNILFGCRMNKLKFNNILSLIGLSHLMVTESTENVENIIVEGNGKSLSNL